MGAILKAENISKQYRLGKVGTGTLGDDLKRWWYHLRGKEDPFLKVGGVNDRIAKATEDYIWALRDINFEVKQGEVLGIIGKNGAGKSTLLKLLSRVTAPTTGSIKTKGRIASLLEIGTGFHPELTGRENIFMNGAVLGMTKAEIKTKLDEIIAFSGCEMYIDTPVKRYSSGMTVRLGFAVAAHLEPEILVVDEVLAVGDAEFQKKAIGKMNSLSKGEGRTVLFVSHNMSSVQSLCNRAILLENGRITFEGQTHRVISEYLKGNRESLTDLISLEDRAGQGKILFSKLVLGNPYSNTNTFRIGEKIGFHFDFFLRENLLTSKIRILIGVYNEKDEGIIRFDSDATASLHVDEKVTKGSISCIMEDHLNLMPGHYSVNIAIFNDGVLQDHIAGKVMFDIVNDNYLGGTKTLDDNSLSKVLYKHSWKLNSETEEYL